MSSSVPKTILNVESAFDKYCVFKKCYLNLYNGSPSVWLCSPPQSLAVEQFAQLKLFVGCKLQPPLVPMR
jgi:hypothetical protein